MENELIFAAISAGCSLAGSVLLIAGAKKGVTLNVASAAVYLLAAVLRLVSLEYVYSTASIFFIATMVFGLLCNMVLIVCKKLRV